MTLVIKENQKLRAISYTRLNQHQSAICAPLSQRRWFKHRKYDQPFEIKAQNPCNSWEGRLQNYSGTGRDPITNCEKEISLFEAIKKRSNNLKNYTMPHLQSSPNQCNRRGLCQPRDCLSQNSEIDWMIKVCFDCHASVLQTSLKNCA